MQVSYTKPLMKISAGPHVHDVICLTEAPFTMAEKPMIVYKLYGTILTMNG